MHRHWRWKFEGNRVRYLFALTEALSSNAICLQDGRAHSCSRMKVCHLSLYTEPNKVSIDLVVFTDLGAIGARALYLLDFDGTNLPWLKDTIEKQYPDVKVSII